MHQIRGSASVAQVSDSRSSRPVCGPSPLCADVDATSFAQERVIGTIRTLEWDSDWPACVTMYALGFPRSEGNAYLLVVAGRLAVAAAVLL